MPSPLFPERLAECRAVRIPSELDADQRPRFVAKIAAAVRQQAELAESCTGILRVSGEIDEDGDTLLILHEPATPADPAAPVHPDQRPDLDTLWWLTAATLGALQAASAAKALHGGIQLGSLFLDQAGRPKLGDFGIAPVFEGLGTPDARRWVHCDTAAAEDSHGRTLSGTWRLLTPEDAREFGWIAPHFAHELLERDLRLNFKADQFALGVLLFLLATGEHPYEAAWSDPSLNLYFHLEPLPFEEARPDWAEAFERQRADLTQAADLPVVAWAEAVGRLLASDAAKRFDTPLAAEETVRTFVSPGWAEALRALETATKLLEQGDAEAFLETITPWTHSDAIPGLWRDRLSTWARWVDARKDSIGARRRRERRLTAANDAFDALDLKQARLTARKVTDDPECEDDLRRAADELLGFCDEQERFVESGADAMAAAYLEGARDALRRGELEDARQVLHGVMQDPAMSTKRAAQARRLLGEVELAAQRLERQEGELAEAAREQARGDYAAAQQRLEALLADEHLAKPVAAPARARLEAVHGLVKQRAECFATLDQAQSAWEQADLAAMEARLADVPPDLPDPEVRARRQQAAESRDRLRDALANLREAEHWLMEGQPAAAAAVAEQATGSSEIPEPLLQSLLELATRSRKTEQEQRQAALAQAQTALEQARQSYDAGDAAECRRLLTSDALAAPDLPQDVRSRVAQLAEDCTRLERAAELLHQARAELAREDFDAATGRLDQIETDGVPPPTAEQAQQLREEIVAARQAFITRQQQRLEARLEEAAAALADNRRRAARTALRQVEQSEYLTDSLRARAGELRAALQARRRSPRYLWPAVGAGLALIACVAGWWLLVPPPADDTRPSATVTSDGGAVATAREAAPTETVVAREPGVAAQPTSEPSATVEAEPVEPPVTVEAEPVEPLVTAEAAPVEPLVTAEAEPAEPPVPTFAEAAHEFLSAVRAGLPKDIDGPHLRGEPDTTMRVEAGWRGHRLLPHAELRFDVGEGTFSATPAAVAAWFHPQIAGLSALRRRGELAIRLDPGYDARVTIADADQARVTAVEQATGAVGLITPARLRGDPRSEARFELSARFARNTLTADQAGRAAFATYLRQLQQNRAAATAAAAASAVNLPVGLRVAPPDESSHGPSLELAVFHDRQPLARLPARWDASSLTYVLDTEVARERLRAGVRRLASAPQTRQKLAEDWPDVARRLAVPQAQPGAAYYRRCRLLDLTLLSTEDQELVFKLPVRVSIGAQDAAAEDCITATLHVGFVDGALTWETADLAQARAEIAAELSGFAASSDFRRRRAGEAVRLLADELGMPADLLGAKQDGDTLTAEATASGKTTRYAWTWDALELHYADRRTLAAATLDEQLANLAAAAESAPLSPAELVSALRAVTARKAESYAAGAYRVGPELTDATSEPADLLSQISRQLQTLIAPQPAADPFPVVFVEYYVGSQQVYALGWQARTTGADQIVGVADPRVWRVMPATELRSFADPAAFRDRYSADVELGERLLGRALGRPGEAVPASANGSFGVVVAPHELLWLTRWEQVQCQPRTIEGLAGRGAPDPGTIRFLRRVLEPHQNRRGDESWRRAGLWCVPTLGGAWHGPAENVQLPLGQIVPGKSAVALRFRTYGQNDLLFAYVEDPTRTRDFAWGPYAQQVQRGEIGYTFWNRNWEDAGWRPTPYASFALIRIAPD